MSALFNRLHNWIDDETLTTEDLNQEFNNILDNLVAAELEGYSSINNVPSPSRMDSEVDPYPSSARSYASSIAGEIERLRYMLSSITGEDHWYNAPVSTIAQIYASLQELIAAQASPRNIVKSGAESATGQPQVLVPHGTDRTITMKGSVTPLVVDINGTEYTFDTDISLTGLTAAPSSQNTALVSSTGLTRGWLGVNFTKYTGEDFTRLTIGTVGTNISALVNQVAGFQVVDSGNTEYFTGLVESSTTLAKCLRGSFYDSLVANKERVDLNAGDVITLLKLTYIFIKTDGTLEATYTPLSYGSVSPPTPTAGDYWYDSSGAGEWKRYNGSSFVAANAALIGSCMQTTTSTVAARTFPFFASYSDLNEVKLAISSDLLTIQSRELGQKISVAGTLSDFRWSLLRFPTTGNFASGVTFAASTLYWLYVTREGETIADTRKPYDRSSDLLGWYHPYNPWRCVGAVVSNGGGTAWEYFITMGDMQKDQSPLLSSSSIGDIGSWVISSSSGSFSTNSTSYVDVTNLSVDLFTTGKPVYMTLIPLSNGRITGVTSVTADIRILRDSTVIWEGRIVTAVGESFIPGAVNTLDLVPGGRHTWKIQAKVGNGADSIEFTNITMIAKEWGA